MVDAKRLTILPRLSLLLWHGYLLSGTGSNIYVRNLARELCRQGHTVHLFCQEQNPLAYDFISSARIFTPGNKGLKEIGHRKPSYLAPCFFSRPFIGKVLPVYVWDVYSGFKVKTFLELSKKELGDYIRRNAQALQFYLQKNNIQIVLVNHAVIYPYIASLVCPSLKIPYIVTLHGSALEYVVKKSRLYWDYALKGLLKASQIIVLSSHSKKVALEVFPAQKKELEEKIVVVPAGVDVNFFQPIPDTSQGIENFKKCLPKVLSQKIGGFSAKQHGQLKESLTLSGKELFEKWQQIHLTYDDRVPDSDLLSKLEKISPHDFLLFYVGKFIPNKGVHLVILAAPFIFQSNQAKLVLVGFGSARELLEALVMALASGDLNKVKAVIGGSVFFGDNHKHFQNFLKELEKRGELQHYLSLAREARLKERIVFTGLLDHQELRQFFPLAQVLIVPSLFPEAFGMVVLEAVASGVIPLVADHSGLADIAKIIEEKINWPSLNLRFSTEPATVVFEITTRVKEIFSRDEKEREVLRKKFTNLAQTKFSWPKVVQDLVTLYEQVLS